MSVCKVQQECVEGILNVSGWCLNGQDMSRRFIAAVQIIFYRYPTFVWIIFGKYQELDAFCRLSAGQSAWKVYRG